MSDHQLLLRTLAEFTRSLLTSDDADAVLGDLTAGLVEVLALDGSGVALSRDGHLHFAAATPMEVVELEEAQLRYQQGPGLTAHVSGEVCAISDIAEHREQWPQFCAVAQRLGMVSVAGIPMRVTDQRVGAITVYTREPNRWTDEDIAVAEAMGDMATAYLTNASALRRQVELNGQLRSALDSRLVIEQAKGMVARSRSVTVEEAFERIRGHARSHHVTVRAVSEAIVGLGMQI